MLYESKVEGCGLRRSTRGTHTGEVQGSTVAAKVLWFSEHRVVHRAWQGSWQGSWHRLPCLVPEISCRAFLVRMAVRRPVCTS